MRAVLLTAPLHMMRARDLANRINDLGLYRMRDGRPVEAQQIRARLGNYGHLFRTEGTFIRLTPEGGAHQRRQRVIIRQR